jgi:hypothetical protein
MEEKKNDRQEKPTQIIRKIIPQPAGKIKGTGDFQKADDPHEE